MYTKWGTWVLFLSLSFRLQLYFLFFQKSLYPETKLLTTRTGYDRDYSVDPYPQVSNPSWCLSTINTQIIFLFQYASNSEIYFITSYRKDAKPYNLVWIFFSNLSVKLIDRTNSMDLRLRVSCSTWGYNSMFQTETLSILRSRPSTLRFIFHVDVISQAGSFNFKISNMTGYKQFYSTKNAIEAFGISMQVPSPTILN